MKEEAPRIYSAEGRLAGLVTPGTIRIGVLLILAVGYFVYAPTTRFGFVYDDFAQIVENPRVHSVQFLPQYFTSDVWAQLEGHPQNLYRPLFLAWLLGNFKAFDLQPSYWHLTTILIHLLASVLVYVLARKLIPGQPMAALVAVGIFVLHPSHVEAVAWISGVTEPLASVFFLGSFLCYIEYRSRGARMGWLIASLMLCGAAMLAKETAVVLPAIIASYEWFVGPQASQESSGSSRKLLSALTLSAPFAVLVAVYCVLRMTALHGLAHGFPDVPLWRSLITLPWVVFFYLRQLCVPVGLGLYYDVDYTTGMNAILPMLVLVFATFGAWWLTKKMNSRLPFFLSAWFLLTLSPVLALFVVISRYFNVHDRYLYLPSVAFALLAGQLVATLFENFRTRHKAWLPATAAILWLVALALASRHYTLYWKDNLTLYARGAEVAPRNVLAKLNLASTLFWKGRYADAFVLAEQAVSLDPKMPLVLNAAGQAAYFMGNYSVAETYYLRAQATGPPQVDQLYYLGLSRIKMKRYDEALAVLLKGNSLWPNSPGYHAAIGRALAAQGKWSDAREQYELELRYHPETPGTKEALAEVVAHLSPLHDRAVNQVRPEPAIEKRPGSRKLPR